MILSLKFRVSNEDFAVFTPVLGRRLPIFRHLVGWVDVYVAETSEKVKGYK